LANWQSFTIQVPGKDILEPVRSVLETLLIFLEVLKTILETIKVFLIDFGNPIKALVEALIKLIEELFLSLKATGVYAYFDVPDPTVDPGFNRHVGGFRAFTERFKGSLFDSLDFNRPQPRAGSTQSGFVLLVVDATNIFALISRVKQLLRFFGKEFTSPRYEAPVNLKALPVGNKGDPILAVAAVFTSGPIKAVELSWTLPTSMETPDPGFSDVVMKVASEFIPAKFLIERSSINPAAQKIDISALGTPDAAGTTEFNRSTYTNVSNMGSPVLRRETLRDEFGDAVVKFQKYTILGELDITSILGQLGKFRYIDTDVELGTTYYYRVRAISGSLKMSGNQISFPTTYNQLTFSVEFGSPVMQWPSTSSSDAVVMGKASGILSVTVPQTPDPAVFDVVENLKRLLQTAFSLDFHLPADPKSTFDPSGNPSGITSPMQVGRGSLSNLASALAVFESLLTVGDLSRANTINESFQPDLITGERPELPWQQTIVRKQAARLADAVASSLLQAGADPINGFRSIMQNPLPAGPTNTPVPHTLSSGSVVPSTTLEQLVFGFTPTEDIDTRAATTFVNGYSDASLRLNVLVAVQYIKSFSLGGAPVDWIAVAPLRDIIPWSGQMIYDLLAKVQALLDAFSGVMDEIKAFIDLIERKINALERFIEFLISILNFIQSLELSVFILSVPELSGSAQSWVQAIDTAGGNKPSSGPGGYSAGIGLGYVATDITAFKTAFSIIFG
jgi:hypothetical protein